MHPCLGHLQSLRVALTRVNVETGSQAALAPRVSPVQGGNLFMKHSQIVNNDPYWPCQQDMEAMFLDSDADFEGAKWS